MPYYGMDISAYNVNTDLAAEYTRGLRIVRMKLDEGTYYVNPLARHWWDEAARLGIKRGLYSFVTPGLNAPVAGAHHFLGAMQGQGIVFGPGDTVHMDYEQDGCVGAANPSEWALTWLDEVGRAIGAAPAFPGIYCDRNFASNILTDPRLGQYTWWAAAWTTQDTVNNDGWPSQAQAPSLAGTPFKDIDLWQFSASSHSRFPSADIPGSGVDLDESFLDDYSKYGMRAPQPAQRYKMVTDQWLRALPDASSARLIDLPVGVVVTNYGAPTPHWYWVVYEGKTGWVLKLNAVPVT